METTLTHRTELIQDESGTTETISLKPKRLPNKKHLLNSRIRQPKVLCSFCNTALKVSHMVTHPGNSPITVVSHRCPKRVYHGRTSMVYHKRKWQTIAPRFRLAKSWLAKIFG